MSKIINVSIFLVCITSSIWSAEQELRVEDVRRISAEMFSLHVENKEFSPTVVKRSFRVFIEKYDPEKIYLYKNEADVYLRMDDRKANEIAKQLKKGDFTSYVELNELCQKAIIRNRELRTSIQEQLIEESTSGSLMPPAKMTQHASSEKKIMAYHKEQMLYWLEANKDEVNQNLNKKEQRERILSFYEAKRCKTENNYLLVNNRNEHFLATQISKSIAQSLDAHTAFFTPSEAYSIRFALQKQFCGMGIVFREGIEGIYIQSLVDGGPAQRSGKVKTGDKLVAIDKQAVTGLAFEDVLNELQGPEDSTAALTIQRGDITQDIMIKREKITMDDDRVQVSSEPYADGVIGKITLSSFYDSGQEISAERDLRAALKQLKAEGPIKGLVIDMRGNAGGFLTQAVKIVNLFVSQGVVVIAKYFNGEIQYSRGFDPRVQYQGPLVLLTSKASASAAEVVAKALQDYGAAVVVGDKTTYGKGSMQYQNLTDENAKAYYKVTVGKYYTISLETTQITGVKADVVVPTQYTPFRIGERYLQYPLANDSLGALVNEGAALGKKQPHEELKRLRMLYSQKQGSVWVKMIPQLQKNSMKRIEKDKNFQEFLLEAKKLQEQPSTEAAQKYLVHTQNMEDLQMKESVNIIRDMNIIQKTP